MGVLTLAEKAIGLIFLIISAVTLYLLVFIAPGKDYYLKQDVVSSDLMLLIAGVILTIVLMVIIIFISKRFHLMRSGELREKKDREPILILSIILFILEVIYSISAFFYSDWDPAAVLDCVYKVLQGRQGEVSLDYFSAHPNNLMIVFIYVSVLKLSYMIGKASVLYLMVFQSALFALTGVIVYRIGRELFLYREALILWFMYALWIGFNPWLIITYSDAVGLIFPALLIYLFIKLLKEKKSILIPILMGAAAAAGYTVKPQTVIVYIAAFIIIFAGIPSDNGLMNIKRLFISLVALIITMFFITGVIYPSLKLDLDKKRAFGFSHYIMMGLNNDTDGVYSNEDTNFTNSIEDPVERRAVNIEISKERISAYGTAGLIDHFVKKQLVNFSDGTFAWGIDGDFFAGDHFEGIPDFNTNALREPIHEVITAAGSFYTKFKKMMQLIWLTILFFCIPEGVFYILGKNMPGEDRYDGKDVKAVMMLSLIGITVFELLFEAKARYLFTFIPVFLIISFSGMRRIYIILDGFRKRGHKREKSDLSEDTMNPDTRVKI